LRPCQRYLYAHGVCTSVGVLHRRIYLKSSSIEICKGRYFCPNRRLTAHIHANPVHLASDAVITTDVFGILVIRSVVRAGGVRDKLSKQLSGGGSSSGYDCVLTACTCTALVPASSNNNHTTYSCLHPFIVSTHSSPLFSIIQILLPINYICCDEALRSPHSRRCHLCLCQPPVL
jgi:hypothetical protein